MCPRAAVPKGIALPASGSSGSKITEPNSVFNVFGDNRTHKGCDAQPVPKASLKPLDYEAVRKRKALQLKPYVPKKVKLRSRFAVNTICRSKGTSQQRERANQWEAGDGYVGSSEVRPRGSVAIAAQERRDYIRAKVISGSNKRAKRLVLQFEIENNLKRAEFQLRQDKATRKKLKKAQADARTIVIKIEEDVKIREADVLEEAIAVEKEFMCVAEVMGADIGVTNLDPVGADQ